MALRLLPHEYVFVVHNLKSLSAGFITMYDSDKKCSLFTEAFAWEYQKSRREICSSVRILIHRCFFKRDSKNTTTLEVIHWVLTL